MHKNFYALFVFFAIALATSQSDAQVPLRQWHQPMTVSSQNQMVVTAPTYFVSPAVNPVCCTTVRRCLPVYHYRFMPAPRTYTVTQPMMLKPQVHPAPARMIQQPVVESYPGLEAVNQPFEDPFESD